MFLSVIGLTMLASCSRNYYTVLPQGPRIQMIAVLPAEMIYTGIQPKNVTPEAIANMEETESRIFQQSLFNGILRYANSRRYFMSAGVQDISTTNKLLQDNHVSIRESWTYNDEDLARMLGVDAVVRLRVQKKRYMSDLASMSIGVGRQVLGEIANNNNFFVPWVPNKTNDIYASCNLVCENRTLWNDSYRGAADFNRPSEYVINYITDQFGRHFPCKERR